MRTPKQAFQLVGRLFVILSRGPAPGALGINTASQCIITLSRRQCALVALLSAAMPASPFVCPATIRPQVRPVGEKMSWLTTYETARDWTSPLFAWRSGARKDIEVKDAPLARRETGVSRRLMAHRLRRRPFRPSLSSKSFRAESPSSNQCQAAAFGRPSPVSYVSEPGQKMSVFCRRQTTGPQAPRASRTRRSGQLIVAETGQLRSGRCVRVRARRGSGRRPWRASRP